MNRIEQCIATSFSFDNVGATLFLFIPPKYFALSPGTCIPEQIPSALSAWDKTLSYNLTSRAWDLSLADSCLHSGYPQQLVGTSLSPLDTVLS